MEPTEIDQQFRIMNCIDTLVRVKTSLTLLPAQEDQLDKKLFEFIDELKV